MTANDILKLIDAGYTKEEIAALDTPAAVVPTETPTPEATPEPMPEPAPIVNPAQPTAPSGVTLSNDQFKTLLQQLNVSGASIDVPPEVDLKDKLAEHFKEVTIGK